VLNRARQAVGNIFASSVKVEDEQTGVGITRRNLLKVGAVGGLAMATGGISGCGNDVSANTSKASAPKPVEKTESFGYQSFDKRIEKFINEEVLFQEYSPENKRKLAEMVKVQINHYKNSGDFEERKKNSFKENYKRKREDPEWIEIEKAYAPFKPNPDLLKFILPIIFVESGGNPNADSGIAKGPCQVRIEAAREAAKLLGLKEPSNEDLFEPNLNIKLGLVNLVRLSRTYSDIGIILWAYHLGDGNMNNAIKFYLQDKYKLNEQQTADLFQSLAKGDRPATAALINKEVNFKVNDGRNIKIEKFNAVDLLTSEKVINGIKSMGALGNDTQYYLARILAAKWIYEDRYNEVDPEVFTEEGYINLPPNVSGK